MKLKLLCAGFLVLTGFGIFAQNRPAKANSEPLPNDSIQNSISFLKKYFQESGTWQTENPEIRKSVIGLIHFAEDGGIDAILEKLNLFAREPQVRYVYRPTEQIADSLKVKGYLSYPVIQEKARRLDRSIWSNVDLKSIPLTEELKELDRSRKKPIAPGDTKSILELTDIYLPDSLKNIPANQDSLTNKTLSVARIRHREALRARLLENARLRYNRELQKSNPDSTIKAYREEALSAFSFSMQKDLKDSLKTHNSNILKLYNDSVTASVNDSISRYLKTLRDYAENDSIPVRIYNTSGRNIPLTLRNNQQSGVRFYIRNLQNDSIGVRMMNIDKHSLGIAIDDEVIFDRIAQKKGKEVDFVKNVPEKKITSAPKVFEIISPWTIGGNGTFGFTQTYLNNWKAGGNSAFSFLSVLKGFANYSENKSLKWENSIELRNGWVRQGGNVKQTQKNDDKIELISRLGLSAFKKWYYSTEIDFVTQFFKGYKYPDKTKPISSFMAPAKTLFKLGLDYKPNPNFSLFISPITAKFVYVRDTAKIDQTKYGISHDRKAFWEPGLNTDLRYKIDFSKQVSFETKYKMFLNYQEPLSKVDINWENNLVAQITNRINMTANLYLLYDDNVTFSTGKIGADGKEIFKAKWQTRQLMTIGFSYKINKQTYKRRKVN